MHLSLSINLDNAAFGESDVTRGLELEDILGNVSGSLFAAGRQAFPLALRDSNGNTVGSAEIHDEAPQTNPVPR